MSHAMKLRPRQGHVSPATFSHGSRQSTSVADKPDKRLAHPRKRKMRQLASAFAPVFNARFPVDVWMIILAYYRKVNGGDNELEDLCVVNDEPLFQSRLRHDNLRALSQTNKFLRDLVLPFLWEEVETCSSYLDDTVPPDRLAAYVLRQHSLKLVKTPHIASYIKSFIVSFPNCPTFPFLQLFARCLTVLPNLQYLRITGCGLPLPALEAEFRRRRIPGVSQLILPVNAYPMLRAFPLVTDLIVTRPCFGWMSTPFSPNYGSVLHKAVLAYCPHLNSLTTDVFVHPHMSDWLGGRQPDYGQRLNASAPLISTIVDC
ncbi:hypothetical protein BDY19DRAFT_262863 [Irpex rosettiformis]|uniref:Uncharacterized protein n=1 Tax=Irpex rosettiformis TaxID=378272 RepID=A0ACB8UGX1_9APHY|nr:hypothetical protein BDY19DRAFT_262863 [Irpex rosettiformis]